MDETQSIMREPAQTVQLALHGGPKTVQSQFVWPVFDEREVNTVADLVRSGQWGNPDCTGLVAEFEAQFAAYCGTKYAISCVNGSVSLRLALMACGVRPGDEVIVPPYTFIATASTVLEVNCVPVFVDLDPDTYNLDPARIEAAITDRTRAIIPVHFAGLPCDMDAIMAIAERYNLRVIEDAAHAHGAEYRGRKLGSIGDLGSFSFQSSKNLTSGEGGMVITNDDALYRTVESLRNVGRLPEGQWYDHFNPGCNYRISPLQAGLLIEQLKRLDDQTRRRHENGLYLDSLLGAIDGIRPMSRGNAPLVHARHLYLFRYNKQAFANLPKAEFVQMLAAEGVPCSGGYPHPLYKQPLFQNRNWMCYAIPDWVDYGPVHCPVAEHACSDEGIWIFQHALLGTRTDMDAFADAIRKIQQAMTGL
ncbi:DegT/DnrJ/EryC1/StrS family aminotransferase [Rudanella lutea]|uniref:DegT/DnrJ/EryC1/StrS family aminotransferase n=1 Tax=Rudanella lutea TaxID=451374 RepID=UPI001FDF3276|nr:DegT/DnrJ/EryC1/StrS family aminotransferase [Rudanella lutea]